MNEGIGDPDLKPSMHFQTMLYNTCIPNNYIN